MKSEGTSSVISIVFMQTLSLFLHPDALRAISSGLFWAQQKNGADHLEL